MNRRKFILGAGAVVALGATVGLPKFTENVNSGQITTAGIRRAKAALKAAGVPKNYFIVVGKESDAHRIWQLMGCPKNVKVSGIGGMVCGYRADMIIYDEYSPTDSVALDGRYHDWFNSVVRTRLVPDGKMVQATHTVRDFDWGQQTGIATEFREDDYGPIVRNAARVHLPPAQVSSDERLQAKALLYTWFIEKHG